MDLNAELNAHSRVDFLAGQNKKSQIRRQPVNGGNQSKKNSRQNKRKRKNKSVSFILRFFISFVHLK